MKRAWMVRAGRNGEREHAAFSEGLAIAGWEEIDQDLSDMTTRMELRQVVEHTYPDASPARVANWTGQLWRMTVEMRVGDYVVTPLRNTSEVAVGRIAGNYQYRADSPPGFRHVRKVEWLRTDIPRSAIKQDLLDSMGSLLTICQLARFGATERIASLASSGADPGPYVDDEDARINSRTELADRAAKGTIDQPLTMSVRDLIGTWGAIRRSASVVDQVQQELADLGLVTRPAFTDAGIDDKIDILVIGDEPDRSESADPASPLEDAEATSSPTLAPRIGVIESANTGMVVTVGPSDPISAAITRMILHGYSQLAVVDGEGEEIQLKGAISWASIGRQSVAARPQTVADAMFIVRAVHHREFLLPLVDEVYRNDFLFIHSDESPLTGIVTAADLTRRFGQTARPLVLMEEAERRLRDNVDENFTDDDFKSAGVRYNAASGLPPTIGNYVHLLKRPEMWHKLGWSIDHDFFMLHLQRLNALRNDFMHFSPDPISDEQLEALEGFVWLLRAVDSRD